MSGELAVILFSTLIGMIGLLGYAWGRCHEAREKPAWKNTIENRKRALAEAHREAVEATNNDGR